jgi:hypothetical protein
MQPQKPATEASATWRPPSLLPFHWHVYDVGSALPEGWDAELLDLARGEAVRHTFRTTMSTAREQPDAEIPLEAVSGERLTAEAPWIHDLYAGWFRRLAGRLTDEQLLTTSTLNRALSRNILRGDVPVPRRQQPDAGPAVPDRPVRADRRRARRRP